MRLTKLVINNFRSFGPRETVINISSMTAFLGHNSSGKTATLNALQVLFGNSKIVSSDFHVPLDKASDDISDNKFYIEAYFEFFNQENEGDDYAIPSYFENFIIDEPDSHPYIIIRLDANYKEGTSPEGLIDYEYNYVKNKEKKDFKPISRSERDKIQVFYIPATRNPAEQLKNATGTILWRILKHINWKDKDKHQIDNKIEELNETVVNQEGLGLVKQIISSQWKNYHRDSRYSEANIKFSSNTLDDILKKLDVEFTPSHTDNAFTIDDLGDGLKSLFYLTLLDSLLELESKAIQELSANKEIDKKVLNVNPPALSLILIEEPENHVSPHLIGSVIQNLRSLQHRNNSQVLITSHSPSIIKRIDPTEIRHLRAENGESILNEIPLPSKTDESYKYIKNAIQAYPELYFSSLVILGEGDSEEILIPKFLDLYLEDLDILGVSVVPLGGRHVNHFWRLLYQLKIPFLTLLDLDRERDGGGWGRIKYALEQLIVNRYQKTDILEINSSQKITTTELATLHKCSDYSNLETWINHLKDYNVYFSAPLDIDYLMLEHFSDAYISTLKSSEGPMLKINGINKRIYNLTEDDKKSIAYCEKINKDVKNTLKDNGSSGHTYTNNQKELMIWYTYFFLSRGKPATHLHTFNYIDDKILIDNTPNVFKDISDKIKKLSHQEE